jgi:hypothetical protein
MDRLEGVVKAAVTGFCLKRFGAGGSEGGVFTSPAKPLACISAIRRRRRLPFLLNHLTSSPLHPLPFSLFFLLHTQLSHYGASAKKLREAPCTLQLVLLPFGEDKGGDYSVYSGEVEGKALLKWLTDDMPGGYTTEVSDDSFR